MNSEFVAIAGTLLFGISIVLIVVFFAYADRRENTRLIDEWYAKGPFKAKWTLSGIEATDTQYGFPTRSFGDDEYGAKLFCAGRNKSRAKEVERVELYKQKAGQEIQ